jgi:hypothetical protein
VSARSRPHREYLDLAAARLDEPLAAADEQRLEAHLATCDACRERVAGYEADRAGLRVLRQLPPPPRDLWPRTSVALDREEARAASWRSMLRGPWATVRSARPRTRGAVAAALSVLVIVALVGSGLLPGLSGPLGPTGVARSTPFSVEPSVIAYVSTRDGNVGVYLGQIDRVCPETPTSTCQPIESDVRKVASFADDFVAQQLSVSPDGRTGAVVGTSAGGGAVYTLRFPDLAEPTEEPTVSPPAAATATPGGPIGSGQTPTPEPTPIQTASLEPPGGPAPEAIIEHVIVVGETPAYSADGTMLAFSAMPADRSRGPDIYLWHSGSEAAVAVTTDHSSIFASWAGDEIVGSRAGAAADGSAGGAGAAKPVSFLLDPVTTEIRELARAAWRPVVDPTGRFVAYWDGTIAPDADGLTWREESGGLYLAPWTAFAPAEEPGPSKTPEPTGKPTEEPTSAATPAGTPTSAPSTKGPEGTPGPSAEVSTEPPTAPPAGETGKPPAATGEPAASPEGTVPPGEPQQLVPGRDYARDPILSWEVRWSPDGQWFGAWIGEAPTSGHPSGNPDAGNLTVGSVDRATGRLARERILEQAPAVRGFALGDHRIAWATLPGADGKSEVRLLVWTDNGRGIVKTTPGGGNDTLPAL